MLKKTYRSPIEIKGDGARGEFRAVFSTFNVIDHDRDVTLPGAFTEGQAVRIAYWGHRWEDLPVGRGEIHQDRRQAWVDGRFFLDTSAGSETYQTVKNLGELQEWSYGFDIESSRMGQFEGQDVQFLERLTVYEVSPVMLGAGVGTHTEQIKSARVAGMTPRAVLAALQVLSAVSIGTPRAALGEIVHLADPRAVKQLIKGMAEPTNRDRVQQGVIDAWGPDHDPAWIEAMVDIELARMVEYELRQQEGVAGCMPSRALAEGAIAAWAAAPAS